MSQKILCVTDLDGTFIKDSIRISDEDLQAYRKLKTFSDFSIATGRSIKEINYITHNKVSSHHFIAFNGALIEDQNHNILFKKCIPPVTVKKILHFLKQEKLIFDALDGNERIGNFHHEHPERLWNMELKTPADPFHALEHLSIYKFNVRPERAQTSTYVKKLKDTLPECEVYQSGGTRIEITAKNVSKGEALKHISRDYDLIIAIGDSGNDISMFEEASLSFCMSHAPENVKVHATYVVDSFNEAVDHIYELLAQSRKCAHTPLPIL